MPHDPDTIFKALRLVPEFDGNPNVLTRFINICNQIVHQYAGDQQGDELGNLCLLNGILNKITGPAASTINANGIPDNWQGIKNALINNFSDQRDETALYNDLSLATQGGKSPQEFYDQCQTLFSTIMTYVTLHESIPTTIEAKRALYKKVTMQSFVRGLKEPLGSRIRCMRPESIEKALEYVHEEQNVMYVQQRNEPSKIVQQPPKMHMQIPAAMPAPMRVFQGPAVSNWPAPPGQRPWQPQSQPFKFNPPQNQPLNRMPNRTQQIFRAFPPNYNPQSNVFRIPPRNNQPHSSFPKPMSGVQNFTPKVLPPAIMTGNDWRRSGNPPPSNYFKSREMNMNECTDYDNYYLSESYYEPEYEYYTDYPEYDSSYTSAQCDPDVPHYDSMYDNQITDKNQPQPSASRDQDFHKDMTSKRQT
jgi:hypothetical protein